MSQIRFEAQTTEKGFEQFYLLKIPSPGFVTMAANSLITNDLETLPRTVTKSDD